MSYFQPSVTTYFQMAGNNPLNNTRLGRPRGLTCLQGNMRRSKPSLLTLLVDTANKTIHPNGVDIFLITEPPTVCATNKLLNVSNDIYNVFTEIKGRAAIITTGIVSWRSVLCTRHNCLPNYD